MTADCCVFKFLRRSVAWTENIWCIFRLKPPFSTYSGVVCGRGLGVIFKRAALIHFQNYLLGHGLLLIVISVSWGISSHWAVCRRSWWRFGIFAELQKRRYRGMTGARRVVYQLSSALMQEKKKKQRVYLNCRVWQVCLVEEIFSLFVYVFFFRYGYTVVIGK